MNERFKELATEARLLTGWPNGEVEYQRFAELIVQECVSLIKPSNDRTAETNVANTKHLIYNHFGMNDSYTSF